MMVSICCRTYNRKNLVVDALRGFLMQETNFPYEVVILDDCSEDGTPELLRDYEKKYPGIVKPVFLSENFYTKRGVYPIAPLFSKATGKYIAECDDDDYWTDPLKLQKQVDYLETHTECVMCYHPFLFYWAESDRYELPSHEKPRDYTSLELVGYSGRGYTIHPSTRLWRNVYNDATAGDFEFCFDDYSMVVMLGMYGGCGFIESIKPSVYRRFPTGNYWGSLSAAAKKQLHVDMNRRAYDFMVSTGIQKYIDIRKKYL